jgi:hypothetical protein
MKGPRMRGEGGGPEVVTGPSNTRSGQRLQLGSRPRRILRVERALTGGEHPGDFGAVDDHAM